jgi:hypothetical protein
VIVLLGIVTGLPTCDGLRVRVGGIRVRVCRSQPQANPHPQAWVGGFVEGLCSALKKKKFKKLATYYIYVLKHPLGPNENLSSGPL